MPAAPANLISARHELYSGFEARPWGNGRRYWTRERCIEVLRQLTRKISGPLPANQHTYNAMKRGKLWPPARRLVEYFGTIAQAWLAAGVPRSHIDRKRQPWSDKEKDYLLDHAGAIPLTELAARLDRTYSGVRTMLGSKGFKLKARENQGYLSALKAAHELNLPYWTVLSLIQLGLLRSRYSAPLHRHLIDPMDVERFRKGPLMPRIIISTIDQAPKKRSLRSLRWVELEEKLERLKPNECVLIEPETGEDPVKMRHWLGSIAKKAGAELRHDPDGKRVWIIPKPQESAASPEQKNGAAARPLDASSQSACAAAAV